MSDVITGPGFYKDSGGKKCEVETVKGNRAIGKDRHGGIDAWTASDGDCFFGWNIVSPWVEPQPEKPDPGEGWRLLDPEELLQPGDEWLINTDAGGRWSPEVYDGAWMGTPSKAQHGRYPKMFHRRRIETPKPQPLLKWVRCLHNDAGATSLYGMNGFYHIHTLAADGSYQPVEVQG